jgi:hypothetical protein
MLYYKILDNNTKAYVTELERRISLFSFYHLSRVDQLSMLLEVVPLACKCNICSQCFPKACLMLISLIINSLYLFLYIFRNVIEF